MSEFTNIYVDLERTTSATGVLDVLGFIQCNDYSLAGTISNPLNLYQFRTYLKYYHDKNQTFFLKGKRVIDISENGLDYNSHVHTSLFETPHKQTHIVITNWVDITTDINNPWSIIISATSTESDRCFIYTNNDNVEIKNGEIELNNSKPIQFGSGGIVDEIDNYYNNINNKLSIVNTKIYTQCETNLVLNYHSLLFENYKQLFIVNSILSNKSYDGSIRITNTFTDDITCYFINDIFYGFKYIVGYPIINGLSKIIANVKQSTFTTSLGTLSNVDIPNFIYNAVDIDDIIDNNNIQFNWGGASACEESFINLNQLTNFNYLDSDWLDISVSGVVKTYNYDNVITQEFCTQTNSFSKVRDGIGALTFLKMGVPYFSVSMLDTEVTVSGISGSSYDLLYNPSQYVWNWDESINNIQLTSSTPDFSATHNYITHGQHSIGLDVYSYNNWYRVSNNILISILSTSANFDWVLLRSSASCFDGELLLNSLDNQGVLSAYTFDDIIVSATNNSTYNNNFKVFDTWGCDFINDIPNMDYWANESIGDFAYPNGSYSVHNKYITSGYHHVYFGVRTNDMNVSASWLPVKIYDKPKQTYYVDLDQYYEISGYKWLYKPTGIYDNFSSGFDSAWSTIFKTTYSVVDMWGTACVSNGIANLLTNPIHNNLDIEWEFVRTNQKFVPYVCLKSNSNIVLKVEWNYNDDFILFTYYGKQYKIKYNLLKLGAVRDLRCTNSLRFLTIRLVHIPESNTINIYIKMFDKWYNYTGLFVGGIENNDNRLYIEVKTDSTTGFTYFQLQSYCGLPYYNGSERYPLTYSEFCRMTTIDDFGNSYLYDGMPTADYQTKFKLKNYRKVTTLYHSLNKYFEIDAWDNNIYGPWMLVYDLHFNSPSMDTSISFKNSKLSHGIIYNIKEPNIDGVFVPTLEISFIYDMYIVWNSFINDDINPFHGFIRMLLSETTNRDYKNHYIDCIGSTIKSERGFIIIKE